MSKDSPDAAAEIAENLSRVRQVIADAARETGRDSAEVTLVAVSKTMPPARVGAALAAGQRVFGENRVQAAEAKWPALRRDWPDATLPLIGPLQTNKVQI